MYVIKSKVRETRMHQRRKILVLCSHIWRRRGERSECINSSSSSNKTKRRKKKDDFKWRNDVFYVINAFVLLRNLILFVQILLLLLRTLFLGSLSRVALFLFSPFHYTLKKLSLFLSNDRTNILSSLLHRAALLREQVTLTLTFESTDYRLRRYVYIRSRENERTNERTKARTTKSSSLLLVKNRLERLFFAAKFYVSFILPRVLRIRISSGHESIDGIPRFILLEVILVVNFRREKLPLWR